MRPGRIRDLFPSQTTTANLLYGVRVTGFTNAAAVVPERAMEVPTGGTNPVEVYARAPQSQVTFKTVTYPVAELAHTLPVHKNTLADEPRLRDIIDSELVDGVKIVEDNEILYGAGGDEKITGIVNTQGVQAYAQADTDKQSVAIRRAATRAVLAYYPPTGVVLHPFDFEDLELETDGQGAYRVAVNVAIGALMAARKPTTKPAAEPAAETAAGSGGAGLETPPAGLSAAAPLDPPPSPTATPETNQVEPTAPGLTAHQPLASGHVDLVDEDGTPMPHDLEQLFDLTHPE